MAEYKVNSFLKENGKYIKQDNFMITSIDLLSTLCNFFERKLQGEKIRIKERCNFIGKMDIDFYFDNGWKYVYYDVPCKYGGQVDNIKLMLESWEK